MRHALALVLAVGIAPFARAEEDPVQLHLDAAPHHEGIAAEISLSITIEGTDNAANFVRSMHPLLSLNHFHAKVEGSHKALAGHKHRVVPDDARVAVRYDDEDSEYDWKRSEPPADLASNKLVQLIWYLALAERGYELSPLGAYKSDDPNQDHTGEALDLYMNGITRLKAGPVQAGDTWTEKWQGERREKNKKGKWRFTQAVTCDRIEERAGRRVAVLTSELTGTLEGDEDPTAEEKWTRCKGKTRVVLDVAAGKILEQEGSGTVTAYFRNTAEDGTKNEVTLRFAAAGSRKVRK